jgi:hypothetical protein
MKVRKQYIALLDNYFKGRGWFSNRVRKLTEEEARPLLDEGKIINYIPEPKRMVRFINAEGKVSILTWGEYLKKVRRQKE